MKRITGFIGKSDARHAKLDYQRNTVYLRFCHADYHKGAALAGGDLIEIPRGISLRRAIIPTTSRAGWKGCRDAILSANAIDEVKAAVRAAGGCRPKQHGTGVRRCCIFYKRRVKR
jgi:hypothetical protein